MTLRFYYLLVVFLGIVPMALAGGDPYPRDTRIDVVHYTFQLVLSDTSDAITGEATLRLRALSPDIVSFALDLDDRSAQESRGMRVRSVLVDDREARFVHRAERLQITLAEPLRNGQEHTVTIVYSGVPADGLIISKNKFGDRTFFGDNWPNRAHYWLPTIDHPSDKASSEFVVRAPAHYKVVSNGVLVEEKEQAGGVRLTHWRNAEPLPTKVMVIGVAEFAVSAPSYSGAPPLQSWVYRENASAGFRDMAPAGPITAWFIEKLGTFPYAKLANVQSTTRYGGMENASTIFYHEDAITGQGRMERLLAHEIAHQWFGDAVTEGDWYHVWLSEGFATYLTELYAEHVGGHQALRKGMEDARNQVFAYYRARPNAPLIDSTVTDLNDLLSPNSYQKGAWVLHMLRYTIGDEAFWKTLRTYYARFGHRNALTSDFQAVAEEVSGMDLGWFFREWTRQAGFPQYRGGWSYEGGKLKIALDQVQPGGTWFSIPIQVAIRTRDGKTRTETLDPRDRRTRFEVSMAEAPASVVLDPEGWILMQADFTTRP